MARKLARLTTFILEPSWLASQNKLAQLEPIVELAQAGSCGALGTTILHVNNYQMVILFYKFVIFNVLDLYI